MFNNDIKERDGSEHKMMTRILFTLKHLEPFHLKKRQLHINIYGFSVVGILLLF